MAHGATAASTAATEVSGELGPMGNSRGTARDGENIFSMYRGDKDNTGVHSVIGRHHCGGGVRTVPVGMSGNDAVGAAARAQTCVALGN
jgi:hypothetical protein